MKLVDLHSVGPLVLHPWGHSEDRSSVPRYDELQKLTRTMAEAINNVHGAQYKPEMVQYDVFPFFLSLDSRMSLLVVDGAKCQGSMLYAHSGTMMDRLLAVNGTLAFVIEVRGPGFDPPPETIEKAGEEIFAGIMALAKTQYTAVGTDLNKSWWDTIFSPRPNSAAVWDNCSLFVVTFVLSSCVSLQSFFLLAYV